MSLVQTHQNGVTQLILNRPDKRNALNPELIEALTIAIHAATHDEETRVLVISGQGKHFSAGADLTHMQDMASASFEANAADATRLATLLHRLYHFPKPTLVKIQGATYGGGLGIIAACDIAIADTHASFCFSEVSLGLLPAVISPFVIAAMGKRRAQALFLSAELFHAEQAQAWGLIHQHIPGDTLEAYVQQQAERLAALPTQTLQACKQLTRTIATHDTNDTTTLIPLTAQLLAAQRCTDDAKTAIARFLE